MGQCSGRLSLQSSLFSSTWKSRSPAHELKLNVAWSVVALSVAAILLKGNDTVCSSWGRRLQEARAELLEVFENIVKNYMIAFETCGVCWFNLVSLQAVWGCFPEEKPFAPGQRCEAAKAAAPSGTMPWAALVPTMEVTATELVAFCFYLYTYNKKMWLFVLALRVKPAEEILKQEVCLMQLWINGGEGWIKKVFWWLVNYPQCLRRVWICQA